MEGSAGGGCPWRTLEYRVSGGEAGGRESVEFGSAVSAGWWQVGNKGSWYREVGKHLARACDLDGWVGASQTYPFVGSSAFL